MPLAHPHAAFFPHSLPLLSAYILKCGIGGTTHTYTHTHMYKVKCKQLRNLTSRKVEPRAYKAKTQADKQTDRETGRQRDRETEIQGDRGRPRHTSKYYYTIWL